MVDGVNLPPAGTGGVPEGQQPPKLRSAERRQSNAPSPLSAEGVAAAAGAGTPVPKSAIKPVGEKGHEEHGSKLQDAAIKGISFAAVHDVVSALKGMSVAERKEIMVDVFSQLKDLAITEKGRALVGLINIYIQKGDEKVIDDILNVCQSHSDDAGAFADGIETLRDIADSREFLDAAKKGQS